MLLDPFLFDFAADHQRGLREAAERTRRAGARRPGWWRLPLRVSVAVESRTVFSAASPRPVCRRRFACWHASSHG